MKIIYHVGETIGAETVVQRGTLVEDGVYPYIQTANGKIELTQLDAVEFFRLNGLGTMVQLRNANTTIYLAVPRIFINVGTGFAIINLLATRKVKTMLANAMKQQAE